MRNRSFSRPILLRIPSHAPFGCAFAALLALTCGLPRLAQAVSVPAWMQSQLNAPLPAHDEKTDALQLYAETVVTLERSGKLQRLERRVYRILRPEGASYGVAKAYSNAFVRITDMHGWSVPAEGKPYEIKNRDAVEGALKGAELASDLRVRVLAIPAAVQGSLIGYEIQSEEQPLIMADEWSFQETVPAQEASYALELPPGWHYKAVWLNHPEQAPSAVDAQHARWQVGDVKPIRLEDRMPPWRGLAGQMFVSFIPPDGRDAGPQDWHQMGSWYLALTKERREGSAQIGQKVRELTAGAPPLTQMRALAEFVQSDIRYVAIELGIGGWQPHAAGEVFAQGYGDCKDKATLMISMLKEIGIDASYVIVNSERGAVTPASPASLGFNHVIVAIHLPTGVADPSLQATIEQPHLGRLLFFDPTDPYTPLGSLRGPLQGGYGLLVGSDGGQLIQLPRTPCDSNAIRRTARMTLDATGALRGDVHETFIGDPAASQRASFVTTQDSDHVKRIESRLGNSFAGFQILKATVSNARVHDRPLEWDYQLEVQHYGKSSGDLLIVRPRLLGSKSSGVMETREPRQNPVEFNSTEQDSDDFEIALPTDYEVDELPPPVNLDYEFASYHSATELTGHTLHYHRVLEIRELSVPVEKARDLRDFYRAIDGDERAAAVLKRVRS